MRCVWRVLFGVRSGQVRKKSMTMLGRAMQGFLKPWRMVAESRFEVLMKSGEIQKFGAVTSSYF